MGAALVAPMAATAEEAPVTELDVVTSTATRSPRALRDAPATVSVTDEREIDRRNVQDLQDLLRYEPGVSISNNPLRSGLGGITIRGISGNRVLQTIDGVRMPDFPGNVQPGTFTRDYIDMEALKRVEIVRGPASSLYGSDALGGVVAYVTKDPTDYLDRVGKDWYLGFKTAFDSADTGLAETATAAARAGWADAMIVVTHRDAHELDNKGDIDPNPQDVDADNVLGKIVMRLGAQDTLKLIGEYRTLAVDTDIRSDVMPPTVLASSGHDVTTRRRIGLEHQHDGAIGFIDRMTLRLSYQEAERSEDSSQDRFSAGAPRLRLTNQRFEQSVAGLDLQLETDANWFGIVNRLTYGIDASFFDTTRPRDRTERNLLTGAVVTTVAGESFPQKSFPDTTTLMGGAYVQDEIRFGSLTVIPGVRFDYYRLEPDPDREFFTSNFSNFPISKVTETAVSPKLGAVLKLDDVYSVFGQYARGFRAPPYDDANFGFTNAAFGYAILPNPNLKSETSDGFEVGVRGAWSDGSSFSLSGFYNRYKDFITQTDVGMAGGLLLFQSVNLSNVTIYGGEAKGQLVLGSGFSLLGSLAYAYGRDDDTNLPIDTVDPLKGVAGLRWETADRMSGLELVGTAVATKSRVSDGTYFKPPSYQTVDILGWWEPAPWITLNAGVFNIFDEKYWIAQDVVGFSAARADIDRFTQPGINAGINAVLRW
jgi:hemoglobin/transferrin/lactoferrin receptor protein